MTYIKEETYIRVFVLFLQFERRHNIQAALGGGETRNGGTRGDGFQRIPQNVGENQGDHLSWRGNLGESTT